MTELNQIAPWVAIIIALAAFLRPIISDRSKDIDRKLDQKADNAAVTDLAKKTEGHEMRVTRLEAEIAHLPDHSTVTSLERMVGSLGKEVAVLSERIKPIAAISDQLQDVLLTRVRGEL